MMLYSVVKQSVLSLPSYGNIISRSGSNSSLKSYIGHFRFADLPRVLVLKLSRVVWLDNYSWRSFFQAALSHWRMRGICLTSAAAHPCQPKAQLKACGRWEFRTQDKAGHTVEQPKDRAWSLSDDTSIMKDQKYRFYCYTREFPLKWTSSKLQYGVVQSLSHVRLFESPRTVAHPASLSFTISRSFLKPMSTHVVMSQWCHPAISSSVIPFSSCLQY